MLIAAWIGWLVWGCLLLAGSLQHPQVPDRQSPGAAHLGLSAAALLLLLLTFSLQPFAGGSLMDYFH